jgi:hypothetical protein
MKDLLRIDDYSLEKITPFNVDFNIGFTTSTGPDISWEPGEPSINFKMDKLNFD